MLWLVRHGIEGFDEVALENNVILYHWEELPDLSKISSRDELRKLFAETYSDSEPRSISAWYGQMWSFMKRMKTGDLVIVTMESSSRVAVGEVTGEYRYDNTIPEGPWHCRPVKWIARNVARSMLPADIRQALSAQLTVCRIERERAEERLRKALEAAPIEGEARHPVEDEVSVLAIDPEKGATDRIHQFIGANFRGHDFEKLVAEILKAKGYTIHVTRPGGDGGIDVLAGRDDLGFGSPCLGVQIKSGEYPVDSGVIVKLGNDLEKFAAEKGLFVAWGGFENRDSIERRKEFFRIRLWDDTDLVRELLENYDSLSPEWKKKIPLKRVWALVE